MGTMRQWANGREEALSGGGKVILVEVKLRKSFRTGLDEITSEGQELLTWTLDHLAKAGDAIKAVHVVKERQEGQHLGKAASEGGLPQAAAEGALSRLLEASWARLAEHKEIRLEPLVAHGASSRAALVEQMALQGASSLVLSAPGTHFFHSPPTEKGRWCAERLPGSCQVFLVRNGRLQLARHGGGGGGGGGARGGGTGAASPSDAGKIARCQSADPPLFSQRPIIDEDTVNSALSAPPPPPLGGPSPQLQREGPLSPPSPPGPKLSHPTVAQRQSEVMSAHLHKTLVHLNGEPMGARQPPGSWAAREENVDALERVMAQLWHQKRLSQNGVLTPQQKGGSSQKKAAPLLHPPRLQPLTVGPQNVQRELSSGRSPSPHSASPPLPSAQSPSPQARAPLPQLASRHHSPSAPPRSPPPASLAPRTPRPVPSQQALQWPHSGADPTLVPSAEPPLPSLSQMTPPSVSPRPGIGSLFEREFGLAELRAATNGFAAENRLGGGASGEVYRGALPEGERIAVKVLRMGGAGRRGRGESALKQMRTEMGVIGRTNHRSLLQLRGVHVSEAHLMLVFPLLENGALDKRLQGHPDREPLTWHQRLRIALGTAEGLKYLNELANPPIIHRDVKSANILLDEKDEPQLADFGLAKMVLESDRLVECTHLMGTFGYIAPEYGQSATVSPKTDVYAFGVVLFELLTGLPAVDPERSDPSLARWGSNLATLLRFDEMADPRLGGGYDADQLRIVAQCATLCCATLPNDRPTMGQVVKVLQEVISLSKS